MSGPMSRAQVALVRATTTVRDFLVHLDILSYTAGASSCMRYPISHRPSQKRAVRPSPMVILAAARKSPLASSGMFNLNSTHGLEWSIHYSQSHLVCKVMFIHRRFGTPSPSAYLGLLNDSHATAHLPPPASSFPHHRKPLQILIIAFMVFGGNPIASMEWTGIALRTDWTSRRRLLLGSVAAFQVGRRAAIWSTISWNCATVCFLIESGRPGYRKGKEPPVQPSSPVTVCICSCVPLIGKAALFCRFIRRPDACPNRSSTHYKKYVNLWPPLLVTERSWFFICDLFVTKNRRSKAGGRKLTIATFLLEWSKTFMTKICPLWRFGH